MSRGTLTVGRLTLKEDYTLVDAVNAASGDRSISLAGVETNPPRAIAELVALGEDLGTLLRQTLPVLFSQKAERNGYYQVQDVNVTSLLWQGEAAAITWTLALNFMGPDNAVDVESRLANVVRANDFTLTGERWHVPAQGHYSYQVGTATPTTVVRTGEAGAITVYRAIPAAINPRWGSAAASYLNGAVRVLNSSVLRAGAGILVTPTGWELNNSLVRLRPETGAVTTTLHVAAYTGGAWQDKSWDIKIGGVTVVPSHIKAATVLRNDPEMCTIRLVVQLPANSARHLIDLSLRRGSRFIEGYVQTVSAATIVVTPDVLEAATNNTATGYTVATANDGAGNRFVVGSARTVTTESNGGIQKAATTTLDFFVGVEAGGTGAVAGDQAVQLRDQYIGAMSETSRMVQL